MGSEHGNPTRQRLSRHQAAEWLETARAQAMESAKAGGVPIGAALFTREGELLGAGHNRRVQEQDPSMHAETAAFKAAGRRRTYRDTVMVTSLSPCWYCSGLVRQFGIGAVVIGESVNLAGGASWLIGLGFEVIDLSDPACIELLGTFIREEPDLWNEDIGVDGLG